MNGPQAFLRVIKILMVKIGDEGFSAAQCNHQVLNNENPLGLNGLHSVANVELGLELHFPLPYCIG